MKTKALPDRAQAALLPDLYAFFRAATESFEQPDSIGADLVYQFGAVLNGSHCTWPADRPLVRLLKERYPADHAVWTFVFVEPEAVAAGSVSCLTLSAPDWFNRPDFLDWRQGQQPGQRGAPACWAPQDRSGEYADVFMTFDRPEAGADWEGSDSDALPEDIYQTIGRLLEERRLSHGVVWIKPV